MRAMFSSTLRPGNSPPSPGLAPWAILICSSSAFVRYQIVTPKRPDATCLIAERLLNRRWAAAESLGIFAPFARVALAADAIHGDGQRFMGFRRNGAEAHRAGAKPLDDVLGRLDFFERNRAAIDRVFEFAASRARCTACASSLLMRSANRQ